MSAPERYSSGTIPQITDSSRTLLVKLILAESGGGGGSSGIQQVYYGVGNPNGVQSPTAASVAFPLLYIDTSTGIIYQKTDLLNTNTGWT